MLHRATCFDNVARLFPKLAKPTHDVNKLVFYVVDIYFSRW